MKNRIKYLREEVLKIKQSELAKRLGVTQTAVSTWESGRHSIPKNRRDEYAAILGIRTEWLVDGTGEIFRPGYSAPGTAVSTSPTPPITDMTDDERRRWLISERCRDFSPDEQKLLLDFIEMVRLRRRNDGELSDRD